jgi:hypothetical protein
MKTSTMHKQKEDNFPIFEVRTEYKDGTIITGWKRPHLPMYVKIALIGMYDENCELKREIRRLHEAKR